MKKTRDPKLQELFLKLLKEIEPQMDSSPTFATEFAGRLAEFADAWAADLPNLDDHQRALQRFADTVQIAGSRKKVIHIRMGGTRGTEGVDKSLPYRPPVTRGRLRLGGKSTVEFRDVSEIPVLDREAVKKAIAEMKKKRQKYLEGRDAKNRKEKGKLALRKLARGREKTRAQATEPE